MRPVNHIVLVPSPTHCGQLEMARASISYQLRVKASEGYSSPYDEQESRPDMVDIFMVRAMCRVDHGRPKANLSIDTDCVWLRCLSTFSLSVDRFRMHIRRPAA
jgi:hypothetical protein